MTNVLVDKECSVPWKCRACGQRGTVEVPADVMAHAVGRLGYLFDATLKQHGVKQRCGLINIFWDWPECWRAAPREELQP